MTRAFLCRLTLFFFIFYFITFVSCSYFLSNASDTSAQPKSESSPLVIVNDRVYRFVGSTTTPFAKSYSENVSLEEGNRIKNKRTNDLEILGSSSSQKLVVEPELDVWDPFAPDPEDNNHDDNNVIDEDLVIESNSQHQSSHHPKNIPEKVFIQMNSVSSADEFLSKFVDMDNADNDSEDKMDIDDNDVHVEELQRGYGDDFSDTQDSSSSHTHSVHHNNRRKVVPKITNAAGCSVEMRTVEIDSPTGSETEVYYPWCVKLPRCSGCCPSRRLKCVATKYSIVNVTAAKLQYDSGFNGRFKFEGMQVFQLQKHESCRCECVQQESDCNENQVYKPDECRCQCKDPNRANDCKKRSDKVWIQDNCQCLCRNRFTCPTGSTFSQESCKCQADDPPALIFDTFPSIRLHSTFDIEFKKQRDFSRRIGSSLGINPDPEPYFPVKYYQITTTEMPQEVIEPSLQHHAQDAEEAKEGDPDNNLYPLPIPSDPEEKDETSESMKSPSNARQVIKSEGQSNAQVNITT